MMPTGHCAQKSYSQHEALAGKGASERTADIGSSTAGSDKSNHEVEGSGGDEGQAKRRRQRRRKANQGDERVASEGGSVPKVPADAVANHFKTRLCKDYEQQGWCSWGQLCIFAHGKTELRTHSDNERLGITNDLAVQRERAKLLTNTKQDRPPPPMNSVVTAAATYQAPSAAAQYGVMAPRVVLDPYTGAPCYVSSIAAAPVLHPVVPAQCIRTTLPTASVAVPAPLYPFGILTSAAPAVTVLAHTAPVSQQPRGAGPALWNAMSPYAAPFVPVEARGGGDLEGAAAMFRSATVTGGNPVGSDVDEDVTDIIWGAMQSIQHNTREPGSVGEEDGYKAERYNGYPLR